MDSDFYLYFSYFCNNITFLHKGKTQNERKIKLINQDYCHYFSKSHLMMQPEYEIILQNNKKTMLRQQKQQWTDLSTQ